jgi:sporulation protein YlmC with PRC-barrel domain
MRLGKDLEGKPIISVADGRIIGRAKDVYVDPDLTNLVGLFIGMEGVIRRRIQVISHVDIVLFGIDVILVKDADVIVDEKKLPEVKQWRRLKELQGREVVTPGGTKLGTVGDVILDEAGDIVGLHLSRVLVKGPLAAQGSIPREAVVDPDQEDGTIGVDLALLEKLTGDIDAQSLEEETDESPKESTVDSAEDEDAQEPVEEEIPIEVVDSEDADNMEESEVEPAATDPSESTNENDLNQ